MFVSSQFVLLMGHGSGMGHHVQLLFIMIHCFGDWHGLMFICTTCQRRIGHHQQSRWLREMRTKLQHWKRKWSSWGQFSNSNICCIMIYLPWVVFSVIMLVIMWEKHNNACGIGFGNGILFFNLVNVWIPKLFEKQVTIKKCSKHWFSFLDHILIPTQVEKMLEALGTCENCSKSF